ncbi:MAG: DegT/DnrJ/EryC1/StrS family aminotransferase [Chitinophagales bacterium]|nr:DegT/DnrJ/EryC1/StrS family aminotransferase [Chitinophagales bacterium]
MHKIEMVDLKRQYLKIKPQIDTAIQSVIDATQFIKGPKVKEFEDNLAKYLQVKHVIGVANGTDALQIAMMALDLQPEDEVITADFTYAATAEVIALLRLKPILVEVNPKTFNIDTKALEKAITPKTKAIVPVHLFGQCADMEAIMKIAEKHNLFVIEDVAQAIGADYTFADKTIHKAGTIGDIGCTSFFPSKNLGCYGDGGALYTNDDILATRIRMIANHGQSVQYYHDKVGVNSRLDTIQAAILNEKLPYLDEYAKRRNELADFYDKAFADCPQLTVPSRKKGSTHVFHQYTLLLNGVNRDEFRKKLAEKNVPSMIYYPIPLHNQKAYQDPRFTDADFPISTDLCQRVVSLPMHTEMDSEQREYIVKSVLESIK